MKKKERKKSKKIKKSSKIKRAKRLKVKHTSKRMSKNVHKINKHHKKETHKKRKLMKHNSVKHIKHLKTSKSVKKTNNDRADKEEIKKTAQKVQEIRQELGKVIVGQEKIINGLLRALICNGHILVEGVPGTAKTLIIKSLGEISGCDVERIQFTIDLLPTDIVGLTMYTEGKGFETIKGPIFTNFLVADEINRAPPKTQSALLEAMQEKQVTIGRQTFKLPLPFFVMATQNPLEQAGVYTLPEAQIDRFIFKLMVGYPKKEEEKAIMKKNINLRTFQSYDLKKIISPSEIIKMQELAKKIHLSEPIEDYITDIVEATRDKKGKLGKYIEWGASPRATINLFIASKAEALMHGRSFVIPEDVKTIALDVLRHRIILNYEAEAENITSDNLISELLKKIPLP